jgi:hypothetical protein
MKFDGALLQRGFWLYVWKICKGQDTWLYVGRTGDSSSPNASSPFNRIGQHLDGRPNAKGNSLSKRLREAGIDPIACAFEMVAIGPLFPEAVDMESHRPVRDQVGAVENALAKLLRGQGYHVLGRHGSTAKVDEAMLNQVREIVNHEFPQV